MLDADTLLQDRYRIIGHIGKGGMGTVYRARDINLGVTVAVKQNFYAEARLIEAFKREARLLAGLRHQALPQVRDYFIDPTGQFLVMEYIAGDDLGTVLEKRTQQIEPKGEAKPFEVKEVLHWAEQLLDALDYLHTRPEPVIHRDIKPQNLKLAERNQIILLDFGLAKGKPVWMTKVTTTGSIYGYTPSYSPIEQIRGVGTDPRSDLYGLGATIYHLITGEPPVDAATRADAFLGGEPDPLRPVSELNPKVPQSISELLMKAMQQHRNNRPASAAEMLKMLRAAKYSTVIDREAREETREQKEEVDETARREKETEIAAEDETEKRLDEERGIETEKQREQKQTAQQATESTVVIEPPLDKQLETARPARKKLFIAGAGLLTILILSVALILLNRGERPTAGFQSASVQANNTNTPTPPAPAPVVRIQPGTFITPGRVYKVSLSNDGNTLTAAGDESTVRLWQPGGTRELTGHTQRGRSVAVSRDGQTIASGSDDGTIRLWRTSDGRLIKTLRGHSGYVFNIGFSADGETLFSASGDKTIKLWRVSDGRVIKTINVPEDGYYIGPISPDLRLVGFYSEDRSFKLWSLTEDTLLRMLDGDVPLYSCGAFSNYGWMLALGSRDGSVQLWRVSDGRMVRAIMIEAQPQQTAVSVARCLVFSADGQTLAAGFENGAIKLWRVSDGNLIKTIEGHTGAVNSLAFSADALTLASGSEDKTVRVWSIEENRQ